MAGRDTLFREPRYARRYEEDRYGGDFGRWLRERETALYRELVGAGWGRLLDAGAGTGKLSVALRDLAECVMACDFSVPMLRRCRVEARKAGADVALTAADLECLPFTDRAFDVVVCSRVVMHLDPWRAGMAELCRVADRQVVLDFPVTLSVAGVDSVLKQLAGGGRDRARTPYRTLDVAEVRDELRRHGFAVVRVERGLVLPHLLHRWVDRPDISSRAEAMLARSGVARMVGSPVTVKAERLERDEAAGTEPGTRETGDGT